MTKTLLSLLVGAGISLGSSITIAATPTDVVATYANIAQAAYEDSVISAKQLHVKIKALLDNPNEVTLAAARQAWVQARVPYMQTEAFRFGNAIVDDWEGRVNAWPLDEGLLDYVDTTQYGDSSDENSYYTANIVANTKLQLGTTWVDVGDITPELLAETLHEADGVEANVATGYHAIEFLLWGQDLNGTEVGAGNRPASDFDLDQCTNGNCDRRRQLLSVLTQLLISDLDEMAAHWQAGGQARLALADQGDMAGLATIFTGMGSLSYGELAGERTKLALLLHDPEEEHDCFSDNTHYSHYYDVKGINNVYFGEYTRLDGSKVQGASLSQLVAQAAPDVDQQLRQDLLSTLAAAQVMVDHAIDKQQPFDVLIAAGNTAGHVVVQNLVDGLVKQTRSIEAAMSVLNLDGVTIEGSDSLDNPDSI